MLHIVRLIGGTDDFVRRAEKTNSKKTGKQKEKLLRIYAQIWTLEVFFLYEKSSKKERRF